MLEHSQTFYGTHLAALLDGSPPELGYPHRRTTDIEMAIKKQEFYEGAALHLLSRTGRITGARYEPPIFEFNGNVVVLLNYSTKTRSPWPFSFMPDELSLLQSVLPPKRVVVGLVCGADGVVAVPYDALRSVAGASTSSIHIACRRNHAEHYRVSGPNGDLPRTIAPSAWQHILD